MSYAWFELFKENRKKSQDKRNPRKRHEVTDNFGVEYRNNKMYIVSGSNAIEELSDDMTVGKIRERLEQIKNDALKYKGL